MKYNEHFVSIPIWHVTGQRSATAQKLSHLCGVENSTAADLPLHVIQCGVRVVDFNGQTISPYAMVEIILKERKENR